MEIRDFIRENKSFCIAFVIVAVLCIVCSWLIYDHARNTENYDSTDGTLERIESGIGSASERIDESKQRVESAEKTIGEAAARVEAGAGVAAEIAGGVEDCERRLDDCIQRAGRIKNIMQDIEAEHRQRTKGTSEAGLAK